MMKIKMKKIKMKKIKMKKIKKIVRVRRMKKALTR
jgi:hypothetical protein